MDIVEIVQNTECFGVKSMVFVTNRQPSVSSSSQVASKRSDAHSLENTLQIALEHARRLTQMYGPEAPEVAIAWDVVEELRTAQRHQTETQRRQTANPQAAFATYCDRYPEARECRIYDV
jgi:hypothetical protein